LSSGKKQRRGRKNRGGSSGERSGERSEERNEANRERDQDISKVGHESSQSPDKGYDARS